MVLELYKNFIINIDWYCLEGGFLLENTPLTNKIPFMKFGNSHNIRKQFPCLAEFSYEMFHNIMKYIQLNSIFCFYSIKVIKILSKKVSYIKLNKIRNKTHNTK